MHPNLTTCTIAETELLAYRDGELAGARRITLTAHIEDCPVCQQRLAAADQVTLTLTAGSPLLDLPVARAAIHDRIARDRPAWWRQRILIGTALPVAVLLLLVIGVNRWLQEEPCASCPPVPPTMQVTAFSGMPAGWGSLLTCPSVPAPARLSSPNTQPVVNRPPMSGPVAGNNPPGQPAQANARPPGPPARAGLAPRTQAPSANRNTVAQANTGSPGCAPGVLGRQPGNELGMVWTGQPGS